MIHVVSNSNNLKKHFLNEKGLQYILVLFRKIVYIFCQQNLYAMVLISNLRYHIVTVYWNFMKGETATMTS